MPKVGIIMGSDSDLKVMSAAAKTLEEFGVEYEMVIISAHRDPAALTGWAQNAEERGLKSIIAGAGMAAALPGMCAALSNLPVIGVPLSGKNLQGMDAVYSILQMPPGVPVATVAIDGAKNAAILAVRMLAVGDDALREKLQAFMRAQKEQVAAKNERLQEVGYQQY
ncbi:MAG: 5-(carboxyamino)imidazole ribonucleotide mutase [Muribaculaceae bacterium]|nr:5-(carboxyamino)imidazole ribonucleotide mutase [Roseburia sp.]MCM1431748.1 5-(carboxyamino)imidazole ribonucleotide mutase [Muribaculaceae bacterium]MCM1493386.1 5-(carboxyamino)imidazole ribonucleotide mutase [Muribaculaceae bacterium]